MGWIARKLDTLCGAVFAGIAGAGLSQLDAFIQQYLQRLGGHRDEARRLFDAITAQERYQQLEPAARQVLAEDSQARVQQIEGALRSLSDADVLSRPFIFIARLDMEIAARTFEQFRPALPADAAGLIYAASGLVLGLLIYELFKWPFAALFGRKPTRRGAADFS